MDSRISSALQSGSLLVCKIELNFATWALNLDSKFLICSRMLRRVFRNKFKSLNVLHITSIATCIRIHSVMSTQWLFLTPSAVSRPSSSIPEHRYFARLNSWDFNQIALSRYGILLLSSSRNALLKVCERLTGLQYFSWSPYHPSKVRSFCSIRISDDWEYYYIAGMSPQLWTIGKNRKNKGVECSRTCRTVLWARLFIFCRHHD